MTYTAQPNSGPQTDTNVRTLTCLTPAKINLFLNITGQRADGYHELTTIMQSISLFDRLTLEPLSEASASSIEFECSDPTLAGKDNLVVKAAECFYRVASLIPSPLKIRLDKHIPHQAGLGGGSSDAAASLRLLNRFYNSPLNDKELHQCAVSLGSDVPFFLTGGQAVATGRGEVIKPVNLAPETQALFNQSKIWIVKPDCGLSTKTAYDWVRDPHLNPNGYKNHPLPLSVDEDGQCQWNNPWPTGLENDFQDIVFSNINILSEFQEYCQKRAKLKVLLCGSGTAIALISLSSEHTLPQDIQAWLDSKQWALYNADFLWSLPDISTH